MKPARRGRGSGGTRPAVGRTSRALAGQYVDHDHIGQVFGALTDLQDDVLREVLPTHGFPVASIEHLRRGDRAGLVAARLDALIDGERDFMEARNVAPPQEQTAGIIADSDASDEEYFDIEYGEPDDDGDGAP